MRRDRDRADIVAVSVLQAVLQHVVTHWNDKPQGEGLALREQVSAILRDEFHALARQIAAERDNHPLNEDED
jgi:hypothetical protein